jgi:hypothetical protein
MEKGQGFGRGGDGRLAELPARARLLPEEEEGPDRWGHLVSKGEREGAYPFGIFPAGPGMDFGTGSKWLPWPFSYFLYFFLFSFSGFLNCYIYFANLIQTKSNKFLNSSNIQHSVLNQ